MIPPLTARTHSDEGVYRVLFVQTIGRCETSYMDRAGKYMGQRGVTLPKR